MKKVGIIISLVLSLFLFLGCQTEEEKVIRDLEKYGYSLKLVNDERAESIEIYSDYLKNIYEVYNDSETHLADLVEIRSEEALSELVVELEDAGLDNIGVTRGNMLLIPVVPDPVRLVLVFFGHNPDDALNR